MSGLGFWIVLLLLGAGALLNTAVMGYFVVRAVLAMRQTRERLPHTGQQALLTAYR